jgi:hypothetical protein
MIDDQYTNPDTLRKRFQSGYTAFAEVENLISVSNAIPTDGNLILQEPVEIRPPFDPNNNGGGGVLLEEILV